MGPCRDRIFGIDVITGECVQPLGASWDDCDNWHKFSHNRLEEEEEKADLILNTIIFNTFGSCKTRSYNGRDGCSNMVRV